MIVFYVFILILALWGVSYRNNEHGRSQYLSKNSTNAIKGICILLVFLRHGNQYIYESGYDYSTIGDKLFALTDGLLGQLIVVMFLFFSGYGVICSIHKKGIDYVKRIPKHRALATLINFDIAIVFFIILAIAMGTPLSCKQVILSFLCWEEVGNSNWYIFVIIACYLSTWIAFSLCGFKENRQRNNILAITINFIILLIVILILVQSGKARCWYDTILVYPLGMLYGAFKGEIESFINIKHNYILILILSVVLFVFSYVTLFIDETSTYSLILKETGWYLRVVSAIIITLLIMMRIKVENGALIWLGSNLFPLYIYQRLPMIIIAKYITCNPYIFFVMSFIITCSIVPIYKKIKVEI